MCPTDSVLFFASEPISEATTAKPLPASPALAASIDALSDKRLVSSAISPISLIISTISLEAKPTLLTASSRLLIDNSILLSASLTCSISIRPFSDTSTVSRILISTESPSFLVSAATPASCVAFSAISLTDTDNWSTVSLSSCIDLDCISAAVFISPDTFLLETACSFNRTDTSPIWDIIWRIA